MDILGQTALLVGVTSFALGFSVLARNVRNKLFISFAILTTLVSCWALAYFMEIISGSGIFYRWHLAFNVWLPPAGLIFIRSMIRLRDLFTRRLLDFTVFASIMLTAVLILHLDATRWVLEIVYFLPIAVVLQLIFIMWTDRRLRRDLKQIPILPGVDFLVFLRRNLIYFGGLLVLCTSVMDHIPFLGKLIPSLGNIGLTVYLFFLSQAITEQRLLNFRALFSRFIVLISVALTLTGVYSILVAWIQNSPGLFVLNSFIASFLILMLLEPLRKTVGYFTQQLLSKKHRHLEQSLQESQRKLVGIVDPGSLFQSVLSTAEQTLQPEWAALFVLKADGTKYRRIRTIGTEPKTDINTESPSATPALKEILSNHPLLQTCETLKQKGELPILLNQILEHEIDHSASKLQREQLLALILGLRALRANLLIPLIDSGRILAFVTLYAPLPPEYWGGSWGFLRLLYPYFEQAARTMRSLEVYSKQREKERLAALGEMAAGLAHEIRNPLGAIKGAAQFLNPEEAELTATQQVTANYQQSKFLRVIIEEVDRLNRVVSQFLDYSKSPSTDFKPVDLTLLAEKTVDIMRASLPAGIQLEFSSNRGGSRSLKFSARVLAAPEQLQQVLMNLIQNSIKAIESRADGNKAGGKIHVEVTTEEAGQQSEVVLSVEDNGCGIRKEHLEKLFIPFFTTSPSGTGLGLSISHKIIESHGGRIEIATDEGVFSRFSVILPYAKG